MLGPATCRRFFVERWRHKLLWFNVNYTSCGPRLFVCHTDDKDPTHQNQEWSVNSNGTITSIMSGKCIEAQDSGTTSGTNVQLNRCTGREGEREGGRERGRERGSAVSCFSLMSPAHFARKGSE